MGPIVRRISACVLAALALGLTSCSGDDDGTFTAVVTFRFRVEGAKPPDDEFLAAATNSLLIAKARAELSLPLDERRLHVGGAIAPGNGGNLAWSWHFVPDEWDLVEESVELCDGTPRMVEDDLEYWLDTVGSFCPWGSRVVEEM
jgi:hypothetical protein